MAARYLAGNPGAATDLVLMGAHSADGDDLSALPVDVLVLAAENDDLVPLHEMRAGMVRLPESARLRIIRGSVHSFFGRYGPQRGDCLPGTTRAVAERQIVRVLGAFLE